MSTTVFKLTGPPPDVVTRRVAFSGRPTWDDLAAKIESIYNIPRNKACVSYVDNDGDEVTLSSNEEIQDYYKFNIKPNEPGNDAIKAIRFTVRDLTVQRDADKPLPQTPHSSNYRNTFGTSGFDSMAYDAEDDWQRIPTFNPQVFVPFAQQEDDGPHAYVETIGSEVSLSKEDDNEDAVSASTITESIEYQAKADKGKRRATVEEVPDIDSAPSAVSMVDAEAPKKMPIHVKQGSQAGTEDIFGVRNPPPIIISPPQETQPSPKVQESAEKLTSEECQTEVKVEVETPEIPDPPLPELEDIPAPAPNVSFANDIATLLNTFSSVFVAHPELAESMRSIVRNTTNGTYWAAHREAITRAAEEIRRGAEQTAEDVRRAAEDAHHAAEEAAGRRVADAVDGFMRAFGHFTGNLAAGISPAPGEPVTSTPVRNDAGPRRPRHFHRRETSSFGSAPRRFSNYEPLDPRFDPFSSSPGFMHRRAHFGSAHPSGPPFTPRAPEGPVPPQSPPAPPFVVPPPPPMGMFMPWSAGIPPPPPPPPPQSWTVPPLPSFGPPQSLWSWAHSGQANNYTVPGPDTSFAAAPASATAPSREPSGSTAPGAETSMFAAIPTSPDSEELAASKARLEAAKEAYKAEKERYRKEREAKRVAEHERRRNVSGESVRPLLEEHKTEGTPEVIPKEDTTDAAAAAGIANSNDNTASVQLATPVRPTNPDDTTPQIVSAARGPYPQLEMFSVPHRSNTMHGTGHRFRPPLGPPPAVGSRPSHYAQRPENPFLPMSPANRAAQNITRRLADMGFTAAKFPTLPGKVNARVGNVAGGMPRDAEDTAVQDVLEELLSQPSLAKPSTSTGLHRSQTIGAPSGSK